MSQTTTGFRLTLKEKEKLEKLARKWRCQSISEFLRLAVSLAEKIDPATARLAQKQ
jgi:hypothetical protein